MNNKLLQRTKQLVALATLGGLISAIAPAAFAAQVSINIGGSYESNPFTATISYDSDLVFTSLGGGDFIAADGNPNLGSITFNYNGSSNTSAIAGILVSKNSVINGDSYAANISFYSEAYSFVIEGFLSPTPFTWDGGLLPTEANPLPFNPQEDVPVAYFFHPHAAVESYEVTSAVPVPAAAWLLGSGLIGLGSLARRRRV